MKQSSFPSQQSTFCCLLPVSPEHGFDLEDVPFTPSFDLEDVPSTPSIHPAHLNPVQILSPIAGQGDQSHGN